MRAERRAVVYSPSMASSAVLRAMCVPITPIRIAVGGTDGGEEGWEGDGEEGRR